MHVLATTVMKQIKPCYSVPDDLREASKSIVTTLDAHFDRNGRLAAPPSMRDQRGVTADNKWAADRLEYLGRQAIVSCQPLNLPAELYVGGWDHVVITFFGDPNRPAPAH